MISIANCTVGTIQGGEIPFGQVIPEGALSEERLKELVALGLVKQYETEPAAEVPPTPDPAVYEQPWSVDPESIKDKPLDVLNMMIAEMAQKHSQEVELFEDVEDARAFLTVNWKPA